MTGKTGLRRFVAGTAGSGPPPAAPPGQAAGAGPAAVPPQDADPGHDADPGRTRLLDTDTEKCDMCTTPIPPGHQHVADLEGSSLMCACRACFLLFTNPEAGGGRYRAVPERYLTDPERPLSEVDWDSLEIPVGLAFFLLSSQGGEVTGFYPSPAGATECRLDLQAWDRVAADHPLLGDLAADVEAILISRSDSRVEYFLVPIDACYELAGRMRLHWRGFDGGAEARESITEFLAGVRDRARPFSQGR
jgi:hypothetical protein